MTAFMTLYDESADPANRDFYSPGFELKSTMSACRKTCCTM